MSKLWSRMQAAEVVVTCGAGGVGKTTTSAAMGLALARAGRSPLVLTVDPARRLADALGQDLGPDPVAVSLPGEPTFHAAMLDAPSSFTKVVAELPVRPADRERLLASRITRELTSGDAGMQDLMAVVELQRMHRDPRFDVIVLDTPPARHALELLEGPARIVGLLSGRTVKTIGRASGLAGRLGRLPGPGRALGRLWGAELLTDIATFLESAEPFGRALADSLDHAERLLRSPRAQFVLVTAPSIAAVQSAEVLTGELRERTHEIAGTIVNRRRAPLAPELTASALTAASATLSAGKLRRSGAIASHLAAIAEHEERALRGATLPGPHRSIAEQPAEADPATVLAAIATALRG